MAMGDQAINQEGARTKGKWGRKPNPEFLFGSDEEIESRGDDTRLAGPDGFSPATSPASFRQTAPEVSTGESVNRAKLRFARGGDFKTRTTGPGKP